MKVIKIWPWNQIKFWAWAWASAAYPFLLRIATCMCEEQLVKMVKWVRAETTEQSWTLADNKQAMKRRKQGAMFSLIISSIALRANAILWCWWIQQSQLTRYHTNWLSRAFVTGSPFTYLFIFTIHSLLLQSCPSFFLFFFMPSSLYQCKSSFLIFQFIFSCLPFLHFLNW